MGTLWHRFLRTGAFILGGLLVGAMFVFAYSNTGRVTIQWTLPGGGFSPSQEVVLWWVVLVPLLLGLGLGYLYAWPARFHHYRQHLRHRRRVHELEKEVRGLNAMLDRVRETPEEPKALPPAESEASRASEREPAAAEEPSLEELGPEEAEEPAASEERAEPEASEAPEPRPEPALAGAPSTGDGGRRRRAKLPPSPQG